MRVIIMIFLLWISAGCADQKAAEAPPVKRSYAYPVSDSSWLDVTGRLYTERRAVSPDGVDIRSASYLRNEDRLDLLIHLRNYDARVKGLPDHQWLVKADVINRQALEVHIAQQAMPLRLLPLPDHSQALVQTAETELDGSVLDKPTRLQLASPDGSLTELPGAAAIYPESVDADVLIHGWKVTSLQLDKGLLHSTRDYAAGELLLKVDGSSAEQLSKWFSISADPVSPARSSISYFCDLPGNDLREDVEWKFPYHMSYSAESWLPPLFLMSGERLVTLLFQPDATGPSSRANYNGIFRLAALDPADGSIRLIEEDMPPKLNMLLRDDVLFFCRPTNGNESTRWEIWATDASGLHKRRLYHSDDSIYLNLADIAGDRLLFFRQFFAREETQPVLFSELLELSTAGLGKGLVNLDKKLGDQVDSPSEIPPINF
jgi:hypothetical protein